MDLVDLLLLLHITKILYVMGKDDRVKVKNDPNGTIWTIVEIKNGNATCMILDYNGPQIETFPIDQLIPADI
jgi:uncharacterized protein YodC (DUF2158 family)